MDRTSRIGLFLTLALFIGFDFAINKFYPAPPPKPHPVATATASPGAVTIAPATAEMTSATGPSATALATATPIAGTLTVLKNDAMKVTFTSAGAAITEIELTQQKADNGGNIILNEQARSNILALQRMARRGHGQFSAPGQWR